MAKVVLGISGSLRHGSVTSKLLRAFGERAPKEIDFRMADISKLPVFNQDLELPEPDFLKEWKAQIKPADGILLVTPEYNRSVPPALKNALDWASRPPGTSAWSGKPTAIAGCSPNALGAFGAVHHLRQALTYLNMPTLQQPEFYLRFAADKFDSSGKLTDKATIEHIDGLWLAFTDFINKLSS